MYRYLLCLCVCAVIAESATKKVSSKAAKRAPAKPAKRPHGTELQVVHTQSPGSLWPSNASSFCDQTSQAGDIVVVEIDTNDTGQWQDNTNLQRNNNGTDLTSIVKSGASLLSNKLNLGNVDLRGVKKHQTSAGSKQMVRIKAQVPAIVQRAERGRVYIEGVQEIVFGGERRSVEVRGFCRATDIQRGAIKFSRLADGQLHIKSKGDYEDIRRLPWSQRMLGRFGLW